MASYTAEDKRNAGGEPADGGEGGKNDATALRRMIEKYDRAVTADLQNRLDYIDDVRFRVGDQWPAALKSDRENSGRPVITVNKIPQFVRQITGDVRQNSPSIKVMPFEGGDKDIAEIYNGLIRNIEQQSHAKYIYSQGADSSVTGGWGAWRITSQYSDDDSFEQDLRIKAIPNALSVVWDPMSQEQSKSDANYCFVHYRLSRAEFKEQWPDATCGDFQVTGDDPDAQLLASWFDQDGIRLAEYWCKEPYTRTICKLQSGLTIDCTDMEPEEVMLLGPVMNGKKPLTRDVKSHKVVSYIISGNEILEGPTPWAGKHIPIIHVPGEEVWVGENRVTHGIVRFLKDPQRVFNYMKSTSVEVVGLQPKMPYIVPAGSIDGHELAWKEAGKSNAPYLLYNPDPQFPSLKPERAQPPVAATGLLQEAALAAEDMHSVTGIYPSSLGQRGAESSGKAIIAREQQGDTGTFVYIDNISMAIAYTGEQLVDLIPRIYDTARIVRVLGEDGQHTMVPINQEVMTKGQGGVQKMLKFDLSVGKYDVVVATGPNFQTRREVAGQGILQFIQALPQAGPLVGDILAGLQDWPQADEVKERLQSLLPPELKPPAMDEEGNPLPPPEPPPDPKVLEMQAKQQMMQAQMEHDTMQAQAEHEHMVMQANAQHELAQQKAQSEAELAATKAENDAKLKWWIASNDMEIEVWKAEMAAHAEDQKVAKEAGRELKSNAPQMKVMSDAMKMILAKISAPTPTKKVRTWRDPQTDELHGELYEDDAPTPLAGMPATEMPTDSLGPAA